MMARKIMAFNNCCMSRNRQGTICGKRDNPIFLVVVSTQFVAIWLRWVQVRHWSGQEVRQGGSCEMPFRVTLQD